MVNRLQRDASRRQYLIRTAVDFGEYCSERCCMIAIEETNTYTAFGHGIGNATMWAYRLAFALGAFVCGGIALVAWFGLPADKSSALLIRHFVGAQREHDRIEIDRLREELRRRAQDLLEEE